MEGTHTPFTNPLLTFYRGKLDVDSKHNLSKVGTGEWGIAFVFLLSEIKYFLKGGTNRGINNET